MKTLVTYKTELEPKREIQTLKFEKGAIFTGAIVQRAVGIHDFMTDREAVQLYSLQPPTTTEVEERRLLCVGTGWQFEVGDEDHLIPIAVARSQNGDFVWHVYEVVRYTIPSGIPSQQ